MKSAVAPVKNVKTFAIAGQALLDRSVHTPGIAVVHGKAGYGKSRTVAWWASRNQASYIRARATWRAAGPMLVAICAELGITPRAKNDDNINMIADVLARSAKPRPLVIDEADYLVKHGVLLDAVRDIHDISGAAVLLIGMEHFVRRLISLQEQEQFVSRITQNVQFKALDREDAAELLSVIGEVGVEPDLVDRLFKETGGNARLLVNAMDQIERHAKNKGLKAVGAQDAKSLKFTLDRRPELLEQLNLQSAKKVDPE